MRASKEKDTANHKEQTSQVNSFSAFLCMGSFRNPGPLKFSLRYTSNYLWACVFTCIQSTRWLILFFSLNSFWSATVRTATAVGYDLTLAELDGEQSSLFFVHGVKEGVSANHCDLPVPGPKYTARLCPPHTQPRSGFTVALTGLREVSSGTLVGNAGLPAAAKIS